MSARAFLVKGAIDSSIPLIGASIRRFRSDVATVPSGHTIEFESSIPRSVGLAGSSAIVIATLRCLCAETGVQLEPVELAQLAHTIERTDLGIAGGWQDQMVQAHGFSALMDFAGTPSISKLQFTTTRTIPVYVAWSAAAGESSGVSHRALRERPAPDEGVVRAFAETAIIAAESLASGDVHSLKQAIDESFDLRAELMTLNPVQRQMVVDARERGACANYTGSGGAIVGVVPKDEQGFKTAMDQAGYDLIMWDAR